MERGYIRVSKATPEEPQAAALRVAGFTDFSNTGNVWRDVQRGSSDDGPPDLPWRRKLIGGCRAGDVVVVHSLEVWSSSVADGIAAMDELGAQGGTLRVLEPPAVFGPGPYEAARAFNRAMEAAVNAAKARPAAEAAKRVRIKKAEKDAKARKEGKELWLNRDLKTTEVLARVRFKERTMYRWWGPRHAEVVKGRRPKSK